jgi:hypothetical protein
MYAPVLAILGVLAIIVRVMAFAKRKTQKTAAIESAR